MILAGVARSLGSELPNNRRQSRLDPSGSLVFNSADSRMRSALRFRSFCKNLQSPLDNPHFREDPRLISTDDGQTDRQG